LELLAYLFGLETSKANQTRPSNGSSLTFLTRPFECFDAVLFQVILLDAGSFRGKFVCSYRFPLIYFLVVFNCHV